MDEDFNEEAQLEAVQRKIEQEYEKNKHVIEK